MVLPLTKPKIGLNLLARALRERWETTQKDRLIALKTCVSIMQDANFSPAVRLKAVAEYRQVTEVNIELYKLASGIPSKIIVHMENRGKDVSKPIPQSVLDTLAIIDAGESCTSDLSGNGASKFVNPSRAPSQTNPFLD